MLFTLATVLLVACTGGGRLLSESSEGTNLYQVPFSAPDYLREHAKYLDEEIFQIGDHKVWDYNTPNRGFGNVIMIEGDDGIIIVDTTTSHDHATVAYKAFRELTEKPVVAIIYTHHHGDHIGGAAAFVDREAAERGEIRVIAAQNFMRELGDENQATGPLMGLRATYMYGQLLDPDGDGRDYHISCCGYRLGGGGTSFIVPNTFVDGSQDFEIAGVRLTLFQTGGESASHIAVYLPESKIMLTGDEIQGPNYPNLHSLRGTKPRDALKWIHALDRMLEYEVDYLVPSHGQPVIGNQESAEVLTLYRDVIQFTHDQSVRYINKGYTPDELANTIRLPEYLDVEPWTKEMYGTVKHNVREYFVAYISWWNGDPIELDPIPRREKAERLVRLMGGRDAVFAEAEKVFYSGDAQWAGELATLLIRIDLDDMPARHLKAAAFRTIGYLTANTNWRGFFLTSALELEGQLDPNRIQSEIARSLFKPAQLPTEQLLEMLRYRVNAEAIGDKHLKIAYHFSDTKENFTLEIRNSILQIHRWLLVDRDVTMTMKRTLLDSVFRGETDYARAIKDGLIDVDGSRLSLLSFSKAFDRSPANAYTTLR